MKQKLFTLLILSILISCKQNKKSTKEIDDKEIIIEMDTKTHNQDKLINQIENTHNRFSKALSQFTEAELNKVPFEGSWTAGQVAEHIIMSNNGILEQVLNGKTELTERPYDEQAKVVQNIFRNKEKMKSATVIEPSEPPHNLDTLLSTLQKQKELQLEAVKLKELKALISELEFPPSPDGLTRYEWLILMMEHAERHRNQIDNIYKELQ